MSETNFKPRLGLWDATMIVSGSMIGSGIFIVSADMTRTLGSPGWLLLAWVVTALMTVSAAISYGELSAMFPKAGGQYIYLKEAFNPLLAFLYGWSLFAVIQTGTIAAVGVAFSKFTAYLIPSVSEDLVLFNLGFVHVSPAQVLSIAVILLLTFFNTRGVEGGKILQTVFTLIKLVSIFGLIGYGFIKMDTDVLSANWSHAWDLHKINADGSFQKYGVLAALGAFATAMVGSIFSSDAWYSVTFIAGEIKNPKRNVGLALFLGTFLVGVIYLLANVMYTAVLPMNEIAFAAKDRVAVTTANVIFGSIGTVLIAVMIMISTFSCINGLVLAGARVYYAMAKDGLFFKKVGQLNKYSVPQVGLWLQGALASIWCLSGKYGDLLDMVSFVVILFCILTIYGIFVLRKKMPQAERPYKAFGFPWVAGLYLLMGSAFCLFLIFNKPTYAGGGLIIALMGIPVYYRALRKKSQS